MQEPRNCTTAALAALAAERVAEMHVEVNGEVLPATAADAAVVDQVTCLAATAKTLQEFLAALRLADAPV